jgi:23S rRNA (guanine745-N1)-methyltransferase
MPPSGSSARPNCAVSAVLAELIPLLACPHCGGALAAAATQLRCGRGHAFDVARQGYVSLLAAGSDAGGGDTAAMVAAREAFLGSGAFAPLAAALAEQAARALAGRDGGAVIDAGAGTGYYLGRVLDRLPACVGLALDLSRPALRRAARAHPRMGAVACDLAARLPVQPRAAALALSVFAPRNAGELHRVLRPEGALLVATPTDQHLAELTSALGLLAVDPHKQARLAERLGAGFALVEQAPCSFALALDRRAAAALAGMGPSAFHADRVRDLEARLEVLPEPLPVTASLLVARYRPL